MIHFKAPIALLEVPTADGRVLADLGNASVRMTPLVPVWVAQASDLWPSAPGPIGRVDALSRDYDLDRECVVLYAEGVLEDHPENRAAALRLAAGEAFLSVGMDDFTFPESELLDPDATWEELMEAPGPLRMTSWRVAELTWFEGTDGRPWDLPLPEVDIVPPPELAVPAVRPELTPEQVRTLMRATFVLRKEMERAVRVIVPNLVEVFANLSRQMDLLRASGVLDLAEEARLENLVGGEILPDAMHGMPDDVPQDEHLCPSCSQPVRVRSLSGLLHPHNDDCPLYDGEDPG